MKIRLEHGDCVLEVEDTEDASVGAQLLAIWNEAAEVINGKWRVGDVPVPPGAYVDKWGPDDELSFRFDTDGTVTACELYYGDWTERELPLEALVHPARWVDRRKSEVRLEAEVKAAAEKLRAEQRETALTEARSRLVRSADGLQATRECAVALSQRMEVLHSHCPLAPRDLASGLVCECPCHSF